MCRLSQECHLLTEEEYGGCSERCDLDLEVWKERDLRQESLLAMNPDYEFVSGCLAACVSKLKDEVWTAKEAAVRILY